ncbi:hypothetical protein R1sor_027301 [Riccia sorocarpa]|uniref:Uncharacterized protein n=1 Tax=Riccia sorocarpa TaxID=122646 RepID=A0ABD3GDT7_9MARC
MDPNAVDMPDPLSTQAIEEAAQQLVVTRDPQSLRFPTRAIINQPVRYLSIGDPCTICGYPAHHSPTCPPPPTFPRPPLEDEDLPTYQEDQDNASSSEVQARPCSPSPARHLQHELTVTPHHASFSHPARSAPTHSSYMIIHGFPVLHPSTQSPLDLNVDPAPAQVMDTDDQDGAHSAQLLTPESAPLGDEEVAQPQS